MRKLLTLLASSLVLLANDCVTTATGTNWNDSTHWTSCGGGTPGAGDTARIANTTIQNVSVTIGRDVAPFAGAGTISASGTTVTGSGTSFTTQFKIGDTLEWSGTPNRRTVTAIATDTSLTIGGGGTTITAGTSYTIRPMAIYQTAALTINTGVTLTLKGDHNIGTATLTVSGGAAVTYGSTINWYTRLGAGENGQTATVTAVGASNSRITWNSASSSVQGVIIDSSAANSCEFRYVDFTDLGSSTVTAIQCQPGANKKWTFSNNTFTRVGKIMPNNTIPLSADAVFQYNRVVAVPSGVTTAQFTQVDVFMAATGAATGARAFAGNMMEVPNIRVRLNCGNGTSDNFPITNNLFYMMLCGGGSGLNNAVSMDRNVIHINWLSNGNSDYSFIGKGGTTVDRNYLIMDGGDSEGPHNLMSEDGNTTTADGSTGGNWTYKRSIIERTGRATDNIFHPMNSATRWRVYSVENLLVLPQTQDGIGPGPFTCRCDFSPDVRYRNVTALNDHPGVNTMDGTMANGGSNPGWNLTFPVTAATNASPIVLTVTGSIFTSTFPTVVWVYGATGNTAANGRWSGVTAGSTTTITLTGSTGNGTFTGSGVTYVTTRPQITGISGSTVTATGHGFGTGATNMAVNISGVVGCTSANGDWYINNITSNTFDLVGFGGCNSAYVGTGGGGAGGGEVGRYTISQQINNLIWANQVYSGGNNSGYFTGYQTGTPTPSPDFTMPLGIFSNAMYNTRSGSWLDQNGANGISGYLGIANLRNTNRPAATALGTVDLGTSTGSKTAGPWFVDPTRNFATFDSAYLGNNATSPGTGWNSVTYTGRGAWATSTAYNVNDVISTTFNGQKVNLRCLTAHTSAATAGGNTATGQPGNSAVTGWRANWEFMTAARLRDLWIDDPLAPATCPSGVCQFTDYNLGVVNGRIADLLYAWVRAGFVPQNNRLRGRGVALTNGALAPNGSDLGAIALPPVMPGLSVMVQ